MLFPYAQLKDSAFLIREGPRARVYRCPAIDAGEGDPSVILKEITDEGACGFTDWASLEFLASVPNAVPLVPRFLEGDVDSRAYLVEDLGPSLSLDDALTAGDPAVAVAQSTELAAQYGRLHAATLGGEAAFRELRERLPHATGHGRVSEAERWREARPKLDRWLAELGITPPSGWEEALARVAREYADPGFFLTFTHGDPAPSNNHVRNGEVRLIDFEYGAYRHALYDLTAWWVLCPLPAGVVDAMKSSYREAAATAFPQMSDDACFREGWAVMCAYRALAMLTWIPPRVLEHDHPWAGDWTARRAAVAGVQRLGAAVDGIAWLKPVAEVSAALEGQLLKRFPELDGARPDWAALRGVG